MSKTIPQLDPVSALALTNKIEVSQSDSISVDSLHADFQDVIDDIVNPNAQLETISQVTGLPTALSSIDFQTVYNNDASYPNSEVNLATNGTIQFNYGADVSFGAGLNGITSTLGLRLLPTNGIESIEALVTDNPTNTIFSVVSTIRGSKPLPDMTTTQRDLITSGTKPVALGIYNISLNTPQFWTTDNTWLSMINDQYNQTIGGTKTFTSPIVGNLGGIATNANNITTSQASTNIPFYPLFVQSISSGYQQVRLSTGFSVNAFTNVLSSAGLNLSGLTASLPIFTDASKNLTNTGVSPQNNGGTGTDNSSYVASAIIFQDLGGIRFGSTGNLTYGAAGLTVGNNITISDVSKTLQIASLSASQLVVTDGSKNLISGGSIPSGIFAQTTINSAGTVSLALQTRYIVTYSGGQATGTLPTATGSGKTIEIAGALTSSSSGWKVNAQGTDKIQIGNQSSSLGGSVASTIGSSTDCMTFIDALPNIWLTYPSSGSGFIPL